MNILAILITTHIIACVLNPALYVVRDIPSSFKPFFLSVCPGINLITLIYNLYAARKVYLSENY